MTKTFAAAFDPTSKACRLQLILKRRKKWRKRNSEKRLGKKERHEKDRRNENEEKR